MEVGDGGGPRDGAGPSRATIPKIHYVGPMTPFSSALPLDGLLAASRADAAFKADVLAFAAFQRSDRLVVVGHAPRVKVLRVVAQLLHREPTLAIERVRIVGAAGCSDFRGELTAVVDAEPRTWDFVWDCRWRAREAGLVDAWGYPDQSTAAREFGWRCFAVWRARVDVVMRTG